MRPEAAAGTVITIMVVLAGILLLAVLSVTIVGPGERGVMLVFGQVQQQTLNEGLHLKIPLMQDIRIMDVKTQKLEIEAGAASKDLQVVTTNVALNFRIAPDAVHKLYQDVGTAYQSKVIDPAIQESVKAATAKFTAEELITQRAIVKLNIENNLEERLSSFNIEVQNLSITNFEFSDKFNTSIEDKMVEEQNIFKAENQFRRIVIEAEQTVTKARAESDSKKLQADADAYRLREVAEAEAYQVEVIGAAKAEALRLQKEQITPELNDLKAIEKWSGELPYFLGSGVVPFLNVETQ